MYVYIFPIFLNFVYWLDKLIVVVDKTFQYNSRKIVCSEPSKMEDPSVFFFVEFDSFTSYLLEAGE